MAPRRGYLIYVVRAQQLRDRETFHLLNSLPDGADAYPKVAEVLGSLRDSPDIEVDERTERAFDVTASSKKRRTIWVEGEAGRYGVAGNSTNVDTGDRRPFSDRDANMTSKRAMFYLPKQSKLGLLFCERVGASHLRTNLEKSVLQPVGHAHEVTFRLDAYVDVAAWTRYIDEAEGYQVKSVWRPTTIEGEVASGARDAGELKMALSGAAAMTTIGRLKSFLREKFTGDGPTGIEIEVPQSLTPANADDFQRRRVEVVLDGPEGRKTLVFENEQPPAFVYELDGNLQDSVLRQTWEAEIDRLSQAYGESVLPGWHSES